MSWIQIGIWCLQCEEKMKTRGMLYLKWARDVNKMKMKVDEKKMFVVVFIWYKHVGKLNFS